MIHLECFRADGTSYCIETKRCNAITVECDVIDVTLTNLSGHQQLRMSNGWGDGRKVAFRQSVDFVLA
jgi:hypothetical protein